VRSKILTIDQLPSSDCVLNIVVQEENHKSLMLGRENQSESVAAFATMSRDRMSTNMTKKVGCTHCGRFGHDKSTWY